MTQTSPSLNLLTNLLTVPQPPVPAPTTTSLKFRWADRELLCKVTTLRQVWTFSVTCQGEAPALTVADRKVILEYPSKGELCSSHHISVEYIHI